MSCLGQAKGKRQGGSGFPLGPFQVELFLLSLLGEEPCFFPYRPQNATGKWVCVRLFGTRRTQVRAGISKTKAGDLVTPANRRVPEPRECENLRLLPDGLPHPVSHCLVCLCTAGSGPTGLSAYVHSQDRPRSRRIQEAERWWQKSREK